MSIQIFVHADGANGEPLIADHYEFRHVPRVGEFVVVNEQGEEFTLKVIGVTHFSEAKGDVRSPVSYTQIKCDASF